MSLDASERKSPDLEEAQQTAAKLSPNSASAEDEAEDEAEHAINFKVGNVFYSLLKRPILFIRFNIYIDFKSVSS